MCRGHIFWYLFLATSRQRRDRGSNRVGEYIQVIKVTQKDPEGASKCSCVGVGDPGDVSERKRHQPSLVLLMSQTCLSKRSGNSREKRCQLQKLRYVEASEKLDDLAKAFRHQSWY